MSRRLLVLSFLACASLLAMSARAGLACEHGAAACCARNAQAFVPLPATPAPAVTAAIPMLPVEAPQPLVSGLRAFLDPETGLITSPIGMLQAPFEVAEPDYSNLPQIQLADGSFMIDTRGIMMNDFVIHLDALGHRTFACTNDAKAVPAPVLAPTHAPYAER